MAKGSGTHLQPAESESLGFWPGCRDVEEAPQIVLIWIPTLRSLSSLTLCGRLAPSSSPESGGQPPCDLLKMYEHISGSHLGLLGLLNPICGGGSWQSTSLAYPLRCGCPNLRTTAPRVILSFLRTEAAQSLGPHASPLVYNIHLKTASVTSFPSPCNMSCFFYPHSPIKAAVPGIMCGQNEVQRE